MTKLSRTAIHQKIREIINKKGDILPCFTLYIHKTLNRNVYTTASSLEGYLCLALWRFTVFIYNLFLRCWEIQPITDMYVDV